MFLDFVRRMIRKDRPMGTRTDKINRVLSVVVFFSVVFLTHEITSSSRNYDMDQ